MSMTNRRGLLLGLTSLIASPAIVRASSLMSVRAYGWMHDGIIAFPAALAGVEISMRYWYEGTMLKIDSFSIADHTFKALSLEDIQKPWHLFDDQHALD